MIRRRQLQVLCRTLSGGLLLLAVVAGGCKPRTGNVSGTVKFDGKPLPGGTITFFDDKNGAFSSAIEADGSYSVTGVRAGRARIAVAVPLSIPFESSSMPGIRIEPPKFDVPKIPDKYLGAETSGLACDVRGGDQAHDVELMPWEWSRRGFLRAQPTTYRGRRQITICSPYIELYRFVLPSAEILPCRTPLAANFRVRCLARSSPTG